MLIKLLWRCDEIFIAEYKKWKSLSWGNAIPKDKQGKNNS